MTYYAPTDLSVALQIAALTGGRTVAGGTDVYPSAKQGDRPDHYLDITRISGFGDITHNAKGTRIGAAATWTQIVRADLPAAFDALKQAAREVGSIQIQNAGTLAGNLCNASPAADGIPPLLTLDAAVELTSAARGPRILPLDAFVQGVRSTALAPDELVTAILIPPTPPGAGSAFEKLGSRRYMVISIAMTAALITCDANGRITDARIAVGACSAVAQRLPALEHAALGRHPRELHVAPDHLAPLSPIEDVRGTKSYRLDVVAEQCARAIQRAAGHE